MILKHGATLAVGAALAATLAFPATSFATQAQPDSRSPIASSFSNSLQHAKDSLSNAADEVKQEQENGSCSAADNLLSYDRALIDAIGTQAATGHSICCPGFACAFADSIVSGIANSHEFYGCGTCVWTNWGDSDSWNRNLGSDEAVLKEAYDHIRSGYPTVVHVATNWGEHWLTLVGYQNVTDPDNLSLSNFIALDPWDGAEIVAGENYVLYGDSCQHISDFASV